MKVKRNVVEDNYQRRRSTRSTPDRVVRRRRPLDAARRGGRPGDRMGRCPPPCPPASRRPRTARCRRRRSRGSGERPFGVYVHVPFCTVRCGYCDFNTYTAERAGRRARAPRARRTPRRRSPRSGWPAGCSATGDLPVVDRLLRRGHADAAAARRPGAVVAAIAAEFGLAAGAEVTTESNPDSVAAVDLGRAARGRLHPDLASACSRRCRTCCATLDRTHDPLRVPAVVGWAREAGFDQVSLDLIYGTPGESLDGLADLARRRAGLRARPRLGVLPDRRGRHRAGPAGPPRRGADARRRRPGRQVPAGRRAARGRRAGLVRGVELGRATDAGRCRHNLLLLDRRRLVGRRPRRALPRRRRALVERQAPRGVRRPPRPPGVSPAHAREVLDDETRRVERVLLEIRLREGLPRRRARRRPGAPPSPTWWTRGLRRAPTADRLVLTRRGRLLADAVVRDLLPELEPIRMVSG